LGRVTVTSQLSPRRRTTGCQAALELRLVERLGVRRRDVGVEDADDALAERGDGGIGDARVPVVDARGDGRAPIVQPHSSSNSTTPSAA
jgi:hypothetical protein